MNIKEKSYVFGLLVTDGHLELMERNRGRVQLEVNEKDKDICEKLFHLIPDSHLTSRERDTNFKNSYKSCAFSNNQLAFRQELIDFGFPTENKTLTASIPSQEYSVVDFWRGVIDGDGSLGFTAKGVPFLSLVTKSENLKQEYCKFLLDNFGIEKKINRNTRDNVYNITVFSEDALAISKMLYKNASIYLDRKYNSYLEIQKWVRTTKKLARKKFWTPEEDEYVLTHTIEESMSHLNRTKSSVKNRKYRLESGQV